MLFYRAALPLSSRTLTYVAGIIRRAATGSLWRKLNPGQQALLVLAYLRKGDTFAETAAGFGVGTATAWRYVSETVALLAARAPELRRALDDARLARYAYVVIDGTLIPIDRVAAGRPSCSGKHRRHGMNLQVISSPVGDVLWVSGPLPGAVHDLTAARIWGILTTGIPTPPGWTTPTCRRSFRWSDAATPCQAWTPSTFTHARDAAAAVRLPPAALAARHNRAVQDGATVSRTAPGRDPDRHEKTLGPERQPASRDYTDASRTPEVLTRARRQQASQANFGRSRG
jgi:hypothetical protein